MPERPFQSVRPGRSVTPAEAGRMGDTLSQVSRPTGGPGIAVTYGPGGIEVYDTRPGLILARIIGAGTSVGSGEAAYDAYAWQEQTWDSVSGNWVNGARSGTVTNRPAFAPNLGHINNDSMYPIPAYGPDSIREIIVWLYPLPDESAYLIMLPPEAGSRTPGLMSADSQKFGGEKRWYNNQYIVSSNLYFNEPSSSNHSYLSDGLGLGLEMTSALPPSGIGPTIPIAKLWLRNDADIGLRLIHMSTAPSTPKACYQITEPDASTLRKGVWGTAPTGMVVSGGIVTALGSGGTGTVTSVGLSMPGEFQVTNSPVTGSGTLTVGWTVKAANYVFAGPASGPDATPAFRRLVAADLPAGTGTVTSVELSMPANEFQVLGSPITSSGTISVVWNSIPANRVLAGPTSGGDGTPFFRSLVLADLPVGTLSWSSVPASASASGVAGEIARDTSYLYVCVADNTWRRVAISTW